MDETATCLALGKRLAKLSSKICIFIVFCDDAKIPLGNELPSKGRDEEQIFESNFAP